MSFLCVLTQANASRDATYADTDRLVELLCPYQGQLQYVSLPSGALYLSELADYQALYNEFTCTIPKGSAKNPQTSWMELKADDSELVFNTDPLGTFPIWYLHEGERLIITSEVKSLLALVEKAEIQLNQQAIDKGGKRPADFSPYHNIKRVPPGCTLIVERDLSLSAVGGSPLQYRPAEKFQCIEEAKAELAAALVRSSQSIAQASDHCATFLSGGIDSSTATALMNRLSLNLPTFTLGTEFGDEYLDAEDLANYLEAPHNRVFADQKDASSHFERAIFCNETVDGLTAETLAQLSILSQAASQHVTDVVTGYGADLLFGSMLRHELYMQVTGVDDLQSLIERTCWSGEFSPFFAWSLGIQLHHLFWDPEVMNCAFRIPDEANFDGIREKVPLRTLAVENAFMQHQHAFRKKHAMTDGTQFNRVLSEAYGLADNYSYGAKDQLCVAHLEQLYRIQEFA